MTLTPWETSANDKTLLLDLLLGDLENITGGCFDINYSVPPHG